jgi:hypothetical protein
VGPPSRTSPGSGTWGQLLRQLVHVVTAALVAVGERLGLGAPGGERPAGIRVGDVYEDCFFHPVLCTEIDDDGWVVLSGISLIDGTFPRSCDAQYCAPIRIPVEEVMAVKSDLEGYTRRRKAELSTPDPRLES